MYPNITLLHKFVQASMYIDGSNGDYRISLGGMTILQMLQLYYMFET